MDFFLKETQLIIKGLTIGFKTANGRVIDGLNLTSKDEAYKSIYQYFMIHLRDLLDTTGISKIELFFIVLSRWNKLLQALLKLDAGSIKNALCRSVNYLYINKIPFIKLTTHIESIEMFKDSKSQSQSPFHSYTQIKSDEKLKYIVTKCSSYSINYDNVRENLKKFIKYVVIHSKLSICFTYVFPSQSEDVPAESKHVSQSEDVLLKDVRNPKIKHFLQVLSSDIIDAAVRSVDTFFDVVFKNIMNMLILDNFEGIGTKNNIMIRVDFSTMFLTSPDSLVFNEQNVVIAGNVDGLVKDLNDINGVRQQEYDQEQEQQYKEEEQRRVVLDKKLIETELERVRKLPSSSPRPVLSEEERQRAADELLKYEATTLSQHSKGVPETELASTYKIHYEVFKAWFKCPLREVVEAMRIINESDDESILQYLSNSNLQSHMSFDKVNAKYLLIVGYLQDKLHHPFLLCGNTALQMNCVLLGDTIAQLGERVANDNFNTAFLKPCTDFDCQCVHPEGYKTEPFFTVYNLFLKDKHPIFMTLHEPIIPPDTFKELRKHNTQVLEIRAQHSETTIKVKESDGTFFHSVCDITFVDEKNIPPLVQLFLTNSNNLKLVVQKTDKPLSPPSALDKLNISFKFPCNQSLLFESVGIVDSILKDFKKDDTSEREKLQFFYLLKFASRACQCAYLISLETRLSVNIGVILQTENAKFSNDFILQILYLFLEKPVPDDGNPNNYKLNAAAYRDFYMYKLYHRLNPTIQYAFELLNSYKQLQLPSKAQLNFSLISSYGGNMNKKIKRSKKINKKIKRSKKYKRINKKCHNITCRKKKRQSFRLKNKN